MVKENLDSLFQPIEFTLDGKDYKIERVSPELIEKLSGVDIQTDPIKGVVQQFALLVGVPDEEAAKVDIRKIKKVIEMVMKEITPEGLGKNA